MVLLSATAALLLYIQTPPVPGLCSAPAADHVGAPGCYLSSELPIDAGPGPVWWRITEFADLAAAREAANRLRWATVVSAHGRHWLYVIDEHDTPTGSNDRTTVIGPLARPTSGPVIVRFLESTFPPGMMTRSHAHPGPEAFYVVEGEQCMDSPTARARIGAGQSYILEKGPHLQAAPAGRRNLVALILPATEDWMSLTPEWTPGDFCGR